MTPIIAIAYTHYIWAKPADEILYSNVIDEWKPYEIIIMANFIRFSLITYSAESMAIVMNLYIYTLMQMFRQFCLFMM